MLAVSVTLRLTATADWRLVHAPHGRDPARPGRDYLCIGVYGQMIYVSPDDGVVVVKTAADPHYQVGWQSSRSRSR